jgi:copper(I)-binding protein
MSVATRVVLAAAVLAGVLAASGCTRRAGLEVSELTLNEAPDSAPMRAGYLTVTNRGPRARTLVAAQSDAFGRVEFHRTQIEDGVARMRREDRIEIAAGERLVFEPMGRHLMLMQPTGRAPPAVTLCFADGECVSAATRTP